MAGNIIIGMVNTSAMRAKAPAILCLLWLISFGIGFAALKSAFGILICDDAYITLEHARSWLQGRGPVMSMENPVSATSTPLYTALLAFIGIVSGSNDFEFSAYASNAVFDMLALVLVYRLARRMGQSLPIALLSVSAVGTGISFLAISAYGMETSLYTVLILGGIFLSLGKGKPVLGMAAILLAAPLIRPEGILLNTVLILHAWVRKENRGLLLTYCFLSCFSLAVFLAFYRFGYGNYLPHSVIAKRAGLDIGFMEAMHSWMVNVFHKGPSPGGLRSTIICHSSLAFLAFIGFARMGGLLRASLLLVWPALYFLFFLFTRSSSVVFTWYYQPVIPLLILFLGCGLSNLCGSVKNGEIPAWCGLFALSAIWIYGPFSQGMPTKHRFALEAREMRYREAADILNGVVNGGTVMIDEVGALGYWGRFRILDTHGLLSPEVIPFLNSGLNKEDLWLALERRFNPEWILLPRMLEYEGQWNAHDSLLLADRCLEHELKREGHTYILEMWRTREPGLNCKKGIVH